MFVFFCLFFFNDTATTEIYTLSLHDALPTLASSARLSSSSSRRRPASSRSRTSPSRSEEHTSELQSPVNLVCRLLLEKKTAHRTRLLTSFSFKTKTPTRMSITRSTITPLDLKCYFL